MNFNFNITDLSTYAQQLLTTQPFSTSNIVDVYENLSHDGYDNDGPESNLWDLYVVTKSSSDPSRYTYYEFSAEDWFSDTPVKYEQDAMYESSILLLFSHEDRRIYTTNIDTPTGPILDYDYMGAGRDHRERIRYIKKLEAEHARGGDLMACLTKQDLRPSVLRSLTLKM